ncbi:MAG: hypothetical protein LCH85_03580 [Chloroflexi bacterium]|nr:hypothetical protein [Chloroflexota bacterium]
MTTKRIGYLILIVFIFGITANIGFAADSAIRYPIADFETGVDPRWSQASPAALSISTPSFAWASSQPDNINYWDITSDRDDQNEYADQILNTTSLNLSSYDRLTLTFYTNIYDGGQITSGKGKIQVIIHDTSYGDVVIGTLINGAAQHDIHRNES